MTNTTNTDMLGIDNADRAILRLVQVDNQITHAAIGERIGLSTSAVRRRLVSLRQNGYIEKDVSILKAGAFGVTLIVHIAFGEDTAEGYEQFDEHIKTLASVKQSYHVSGPTDYILIVQGPNLQWYEAWAKKHIMSFPAIKRHDTSVVWSCKKFDTSISV